VIVWINATFGAGKTTTAAELVTLSPTLRLFDPEWVGYLLKANLTDREITDFQHLSAWRRLVPAVADEIIRLTGQSLVAVQTVLDAGYWSELAAGCAGVGHHVFHVVLDAAPATLRDRIEADEVEVQARQWRIDHLTVYETSRAWMTDCADLVVDTTARTPTEVAEVILEHLPPVLAMPAAQKPPIHR
jgi:AAA domain